MKLSEWYKLEGFAALVVSIALIYAANYIARTYIFIYF